MQRRYDSDFERKDIEIIAAAQQSPRLPIFGQENERFCSIFKQTGRFR